MPGETYHFGFVTSELFPITRGGAGVFHFRICDELLKRGHRVRILLDAQPSQAEIFRKRHQRELSKPEGFELTTMAELLGSSEPRAEANVTWYLAKSRQWFAAVSALVAKTELDVLEFPDFYGFGHVAIAAHRWARLAPRTQFVVRAHLALEQIQEQEIGCYVDKAGLLMHRQEQAAIRNADAVLAPTAAYARVVQERYHLTPSQIVLSPLPIESASLAPEAGVRDTVLFVARLFHFKGADIFVDAAVRLLESEPQLDPKIRFVLIGYDSNMGPQLSSFEKFLRDRIPARLAGRFEFTGQIEPREVTSWLGRSICYVCPSRVESFAYSVHESAAMGVPMILGDLPAFADLFTDKVDCLKFDGTAADLAAKIGRLFSDDSTRRKLARPRMAVSNEANTSYEQLAARPRDAKPIAKPRILVVAIESAAAESGEFARAQEAVREAWPDARFLKLSRAEATASKTVPLLGRLWATEGEAVTEDLLMICQTGDRFDVGYLRAAAGAMAEHPELGFIAPCGDKAMIDLELPIWPILHKNALTRSLMRTTPGVWLADLLDRRTQDFGEIAYLWSLEDRGLRGCQWATPSAVFAPSEFSLDDLAIFQSMLLRNTSVDRMQLQSRFLGQMMGRTTETLVIAPPPTAAQRIGRKFFGLLGGDGRRR